LQCEKQNVTLTNKGNQARKGESKMKKNKSNKITGQRELTKEEMKAIAGGGSTVPVPDRYK
jgi:hypothetical protein